MTHYLEELEYPWQSFEVADVQQHGRGRGRGRHAVHSHLGRHRVGGFERASGGRWGELGINGRIGDRDEAQWRAEQLADP